jgi:hypothetical protein
MNLDAETPQLGIGCQDVVHLAPTSQGVDMGVFQQDQGVGPGPVGDFRVETLLEVEGMGVRDSSEMYELGLGIHAYGLPTGEFGNQFMS